MLKSAICRCKCNYGYFQCAIDVNIDEITPGCGVLPGVLHSLCNVKSFVAMNMHDPATVIIYIHWQTMCHFHELYVNYSIIHDFVFICVTICLHNWRAVLINSSTIYEQFPNLSPSPYRQQLPQKKTRANHCFFIIISLYKLQLRPVTNLLCIYNLYVDRTVLTYWQVVTQLPEIHYLKNISHKHHMTLINSFWLYEKNNCNFLQLSPMQNFINYFFFQN